MSSFSASALEKKLSELTNTQQSVQTLSLWIIHHRKHAKTIVQSWRKELLKVKPKKKLTMMYLVNDVLQNSRKKGAEFSKEFSAGLPTAFRHCVKECSEGTVSSLERILGIWKEREVYDNIFLDRLRRALVVKKVQIVEEVESPPPVKKPKVDELRPPDSPPDPDDLIRMLQELEHSASQDAVVRERIANFPSEVTDPSYLEQVDDFETGEKLLTIIEEACQVLNEYNKRLSVEVVDRQEVQRMLTDYAALQRYELVTTELKLEEFQSKLQKVTLVRKELKSHLENLPDLTKLPDPMGLAPLPSAGDLFAKSS